jgi:hypothetical protein
MAASTQPTKAEFEELDKRVRALEDLKLKLEGGASVFKSIFACITAVAAFTGFIGFVWNYSRINSTVEFQKETIAEMKASHTKLAERLQQWEDKSFHHAQAVLRKGEIVSFQGDKLTLLVDLDGKPVEWVLTVEPTLNINIDGKLIPLKDADLRPKTRVEFMTSEDGERVIAIAKLP